KDIPPTLELPEEDGEPLEDSWHRYQMNLLIDCIKTDKTGKEKYYVGGNMFIYFMLEQVEKIGYKGPDFFFVKNPKESGHYRGKWVVWKEDGKFPNIIIELLSPSTKKEDLIHKKALYEKVFKTPEYFCVDNEKPQLYGWRLNNQTYQEIQSDSKGFLFSQELGYKLGMWKGKYLQEENVYLRFFNENYELILTRGELEHKRAEKEKQRADKLEQELLELKKKLKL
ncbi:MAG: Uma2 family endonuclease, partial [Candidatus Pacearchaeota archaeon]